MWRYSMTPFGEQVVALLDHLEIDEAVVARHVAGRQHDARGAVVGARSACAGMVIEMPVLDNALLGCAIAFTPLMVALTFGEPVMRGVGAVARAIPTEALPVLGATSCSTRSARTRRRAPPSCRACSSAASAPHRSRARARSQTPALVIGHRRDPVHPFSDAGMLVEELPNAPPARGRLVLRAAARARAPDRRDRRLPRRVLEAAPQGGRAKRPRNVA